MSDNLPAVVTEGKVRFLPVPMSAEGEAPELDAKANFENRTNTQLPRIEIVHAAGVFKMPDGSTTPKFMARVLDANQCRAYWATREGGNRPPDCSSLDGVVPVPLEAPAQTMAEMCAECHLNRYGTAQNPDGSTGRGKACKQMWRLHLILSEERDLALPVRLTLPPTSIKTWNGILDFLGQFRINYRRPVFEFGLEEHQDGQQHWSTLKIKTLEVPGAQPADPAMARFNWLGPDEATLLIAYLHEWQAACRMQRIEMSDYAAEAVSAGESNGTSDHESFQGQF